MCCDECGGEIEGEEIVVVFPPDLEISFVACETLRFCSSLCLTLYEVVRDAGHSTDLQNLG